MGKAGIKFLAVSKADAKKSVPSRRVLSPLSLSSGVFRLYLLTVGTLFYPLPDHPRHASLDEDEGMVFRVIEAAGNEGQCENETGRP